MDSQEDKRLRAIFAKVKEHESHEWGVSWSAVEKRLTSSGRIAIRALILLLVIVGGSGLYFLFDLEGFDDPSAVTTSLTDLKSEQSSGKAVVPDVVVSEEDELLHTEITTGHSTSTLKPGNFGNGISGKENEVKNLITGIENLETHASVLSSQIDEKNENKTPLKEEVQVKADKDSVFTMEKETSGSENKRRPSPRYRIDFGYLFGILKPNSADRYTIADYRSIPGFGFRMAAEYPLTRVYNFQIYAGPSYQFLSKQFDFTLINYGENVEGQEVKAKVQQHQLGLGLRASGPFQTDLGILYNHSLNSSSWNYLGRNLLTISASRRLWKLGKTGELVVGGSISSPLSGTSSYFKYYPIQLSVGLVGLGK